MLIIFGGLPATGKTAIARELAREIGAVHLRIDSIEQAMRDCGPIDPPLDRAGYVAAYAIAEDNLRIGRTVVADSVNSLAITRDSWLEVAKRAGVCAIEIEVQCSDAEEHRRRVETRTTDISGLKLPSWPDVQSREYEPWHRDHIVIDTAGVSVEEALAKLLQLLAAR
jgi:predicted kinase